MPIALSTTRTGRVMAYVDLLPAVPVRPIRAAVAARLESREEYVHVVVGGCTDAAMLWDICG